MAKQIINVNTPNDLINVTPTANSRQGDPLRSAFIKINDALDRIDANFTELYTFTGADAPANELVNGLHVVSLGTDGALTFPDDLKISNSVISRRLEQLGEGTVDAVGSKLTLTNNSIAMEAYADPDGLNNTQYSRVTAGGSVVLKAATETVGGESSTTVTVGSGFSVVSTDGVTTGTFGVDTSGFVLLSNDHYIEPLSTDLRIASNGSAIISSNSAEVTRTRSWTFDKSGTITTPLMLPLTFYPVLDSEHMTRGVGLTDAPWEFEVQFQVNPDGTVQTSINNPAWPSNPGYINGDEFVYVEADHGIPGYTFSLILTDIVLGEGWSANIAVSQPPVYPSTLSSQGAVKLTANTHSLVLGTDGNLNVPGAVKQGNSKLAFNENGGTNVYLTSTTDDSTAVFINNSSVQAYATEFVNLQVGAGLNELSVTHSLLEAEWVNAREADAFMAAPTIRAWQGLESWLAYPILLNSSPDLDPPMAGNLPSIANAAKNAYNLWQAAIGGTYVGITAGENDWRFDPDGKLTLPVGGDIVNSTGTSVISDQSLNSTDQVQFDRVIATNYLQTAEYKYTGNISGYGSLPVTVAGSSTTVVYSYDNWNTSTKLVFQVEGELDGDTEFVNHTQTCEATVAATFNTAAEPAMSVYGIVHTSATPLATFSVRRGEGLTAGKIEILATNSQTTNNMVVKVQSLQFVSRYD